jgi:hypothetical protein
VAGSRRRQLRMWGTPMIKSLISSFGADVLRLHAVVRSDGHAVNVKVTERFISHVEEVEKKAVVAVLLCHSRAFRGDENVEKSTSFSSPGKVGRKRVFLSVSGSFLG